MKQIQLQQGTPEWLEFRKNGVGASEIASIAGVEGAFKTRQEVLEEKLGAVKALTDYQKQIFNEGHEWEAVVRENMNASGYRYEPVVGVFASDERMFASLDGYDLDKGVVLEVKSVTTKERFKQYCENPPKHYLAQCQWQLMISQARYVNLAFVHDGEVYVACVGPDREMQDWLYSQATKFLKELDAINAGTLPAPVAQVASPQISRLAILKAQEKEMQIQVDMVAEQIKMLAAEILEEHKARKIEAPEVTIEWVEREGAVDYKKIPELAKINLAPYRKKGTKYIKVSLKR